MIKQITRKEWIEALKSGKYEQTTDALYRRGVGYCCLGVLCSIAGNSDDTLDGVGTLDLSRFGIDVSGLGVWYREAVEEADCSPAAVLASKNDSGFTFNQIADLLIFDSWIRGMEQD